jgi:hypothetical protein
VANPAPKHTNAPGPCPACEQKLLDAHPDIADWFRTTVKPTHKDCHVSWSFRDKVSQNMAHAEGKSNLAWPMSAHNKCDDQGNPCSLALDFFKLCSNGMASWEYKYFRVIADEAPKNVEWGGLWKTLGDYDHFQIKLA